MLSRLLGGARRAAKGTRMAEIAAIARRVVEVGDEFANDVPRATAATPELITPRMRAYAQRVADSVTEGGTNALTREFGNPVRVLNHLTRGGTPASGLVDVVVDYHANARALRLAARKALDESGLPWRDADFRAEVARQLEDETAVGEAGRGAQVLRDILSQFQEPLAEIFPGFKPRKNYFPRPVALPQLLDLARRSFPDANPVELARQWMDNPASAPDAARKVIQGNRVHLLQEFAWLDDVKVVKGFANPRTTPGFSILDPLVGLERYLNWYSEWRWGEPARMLYTEVSNLSAARNPSFASYVTALKRGVWNYESGRLLVGGAPAPLLEAAMDAGGALAAMSALAMNLNSMVIQTAGLISAIPLLGYHLGPGILRVARGGAGAVREAYKESRALHLRYERAPHLKELSEPVAKRAGRAAADAMLANLRVLDAPVAAAIYYGGKSMAEARGLTGRAAVEFADRMVVSTLSVSKKGLRALVHENKVAETALMQFALEANGVWQSLASLGDVYNPRTTRFANVAAALVGTYAFNKVFEAMSGRTPLPDPIAASMESWSEVTDNQDYGRAAAVAISEVTSFLRPAAFAVDVLTPEGYRREIFEDTEFGIFGGKPPVVSYAHNIWKAAMPTSDFYTPEERWAVLAPGGVQIRRMMLASRMEKDGGVRIRERFVEYSPTRDWIKVNMFGISALPGVDEAFGGARPEKKAPQQSSGDELDKLLEMIGAGD